MKVDCSNFKEAVSLSLSPSSQSYEEPLLWHYTSSEGSGVDLEPLRNMPIRTGLVPREAIGLPKLKEPEVVRHFVKLSMHNFSIDHGFFPLGSCTMKHNPRINEKIVRLKGFANIHPLQPASTIQGAYEVMIEVQKWLGELTGLKHVCLAPAAGAHGELAGLMTIRRAHELNGQHRRHIVLCPDSAHGTNPATAALCGYQVRTIPTTQNGCVTLENFRTALRLSDKEGCDVAAMMVTNPNTCGLFEREVAQCAAELHRAGGYFYCDGANFNALVGRVRPADFGVDVMHINLHKTFSTPHGGGGPGSGPICVGDELASYLPGPNVIKDGDLWRLEEVHDRPTQCGRMKGFHGHFGMWVRALSYMLSHGRDGLAQVSADAVLNANYILAHLKDDYYAPFGSQRCMHECLLSDKWQKKTSDELSITTLDVAKTLIENGIHPMTIYFPLVVAGAMLIEPTETESKATIDNFINVMKRIARGVREGNVCEFKNSPQTAYRTRIDEVRAARQAILRYRLSN